MTSKFSSKEIHFLKTDSDGFNLKPPETYFSDLLLEKTVQIKTFEKRLSEAKIPGKKFLCAILQISSDVSDSLQEKANDTFEAFFNSFLDNERGIWETLGETSFVLAFWDYDSEKKASRLIVSLKNKMSAALKADILVGVAKFPYHDFSKSQTFANALKAIDHAAFFTPAALIHFDATSLNISGDRLYQLNKSDMAIIEYEKGLEIEPNDINLINSLGVCFGVMGNLDKAKLEFKKAMTINPNELMVIYNIGLLYQIEGDLDKAIVYLRKAHGIDPCIFEVELLLGHLLIKKEQPDQAMPHLETASRINPKSGLAFRMKGEIYLNRNLPGKADREFNRAIKLNPSDAVSLSGYAKSLELRGKNLNIALTFAKNSITFEPDNKLFKERLKIIQEKIEGTTPHKKKNKIA
ncbi:tetratricopeptide repeat protein [Desulfobacula sp.]|uniref:tetratricopeptide repeat protein n=1 Tax=Desulfobacula sp. TaxID=2593537 RepID=UPI002614ED92|nr:tetratricopeptide repeat protein [Desulfobacula sp.]